jgi:hypothetical protein
LSRDIASATRDTEGGTSDLISVLRDRAPRLALAFAAGQAAWPGVNWLRGKVREQRTYTVKVAGNDGIYDELHEWVLGLLPPREQRALVAWSVKRPPMFDSQEVSGLPGRPTALRLRYDGSRQQAVTVAGHRIMVLVTDGTPQAEAGGHWRPPEIVFTASTLAGRRALLGEIEQVLRQSQRTARKPSIRMLDQWGDWERLDDLPPRELDSVILPAGQAERLAADVARFLDSEALYARRCIPWHRGHLYEGPPGTGKTSVARAIASRFGMDVWWLPLADVKRDGDLLRVVGRISPRSMLLLEDVDVFHAVTNRDDDGALTLSGLLNTLDGLVTPHGLLTVLTTNTPEVIDPAVIRPGRVDLVEHFGLADADQAARLISRFYGVPVDAGGLPSGISPSEVVEVCKQHDDPAAAVADLLRAAGTFAA